MSKIKSNSLNTTSGFFPSYSAGDKCYFQSFSMSSEKNYEYHIVFLHDLTDYHEYYESLVSSIVLKSKGKVSAHLLDFIGHGMSSGNRGHLESFEILCRDVISFLNMNQFQKNNGKIILCGHGLGGLVILKLLEQYETYLKTEILGILVVNPLIKFKMNFPTIMNLFGNMELFRLNRLRIVWPFNGFDLCGNTKGAREYDGDPLVLKQLTSGIMREIIDASHSVRSAGYFIDTNSFFQISSSSLVTNQETTKLFQKGMPKHKSTICEYENASHFLYNSSGGDKAARDIYTWIDGLISGELM